MMMWRSREPRFDVASAISQGKREYQEDALVTDFPLGSDIGFAVLADGMGGHAAGDIASKIVVTEVFSELKFQSGDIKAAERNMAHILRQAANAANDCVREHTREHPDTKGMGATLVAPVFVKNLLFWISIGDSPLFLFRKGSLKQLNEDHSMAPQIDLMVRSGMMDPEVGRNHPDRNCLTSVLIGGSVSQVDCPTEPLEVMAGDILVMSSDGLQYLDNAQIEKLLAKNRKRRSCEIAEALLTAIERLGDPDQDNVAFSVIKINHTDSLALRDAASGFDEDDVVENLFDVSQEEDSRAAEASAEKPVKSILSWGENR